MARQLTKDDFDGYPSYDNLLESLGYTMLLCIAENNYQGDSWVLFKDGRRYGYLCFGWGSCSGCDALQACRSLEDLQDLQNHLLKSIHWESGADSMLSWFENRDWEGTYEYRLEECKDFVVRAKQILKWQG